MNHTFLRSWDDVGSCAHDEWDGEERNDTTASREAHAECHIAFGKHGKHVRRTAAWTARYQYYSHEEHRAEVEHPSEAESDDGQKKKLPDESGKHGLRALENHLKVCWFEGETQFKHQQHENGDNN